MKKKILYLILSFMLIPISFLLGTIQPVGVRNLFYDGLDRLFKAKKNIVLIASNDDFTSFYYNSTIDDAWYNSGYSGPVYIGSGKDRWKEFEKEATPDRSGENYKMIEIDARDWPKFDIEKFKYMENELDKTDANKARLYSSYYYFKHNYPSLRFKDYLFEASFTHKDAFTYDTAIPTLIKRDPIAYALGYTLGDWP